MIYIRPGSRVDFIVTLLSIVGEFPYSALNLLGDERVYRKLISKLSQKQSYCHTDTGEVVTAKLLSVSGRGQLKTIRLYKKAHQVLDWYGAKSFYLNAYYSPHFRGGSTYTDRNHRVAEAVAMLMKMGVECRPYVIPRLQEKEFRSGFAEPTFYIAREVKTAGEVEMNKTAFTRMVGAVFTNWGGYAVYNTRNAAMKWRGQGEMKANIALDQLSEKNTGVVEINSAILFCASPEVALETLSEAGKSRRKEYRFDGIYDHIHYVTLDTAGQRLLRQLLIPSLKERQLEVLFDDAERAFGKGRFEYDAKIDDRYIFVFLDGNLAGLSRFKDGIEYYQERGEVLCYPHDVKFVRAFFESGVDIKTIDIELMETELGIRKETDEI